MGDFVEVLMISSAGIVLTLIFRSIFRKQFGVFWRKMIWLLIAVRMLVLWNPSLLSSERLHFSIIPMSSYNDLLIMNVIQRHSSGMPIGLFYETPLVCLFLTGILLISVIKIIAHHEEYGFTINKLIDNTVSLENENIFCLFEQVREELGINHKISLYSSGQISSPMIIGCIHVGIILPEKLVGNYQNGKVSKDYIRCIFLHELTHFQKKDIWYKRLMLFVNDLYWFNPLVYIMRRAAVWDLECFCDKQAVRNCTGELKTIYCNILLDFMGSENERGKFRLNMSGAARKVKERIDYIMEEDTKKKGVLFLTGILMIMFLTGSIQIEKNPDYPFRLINFSDRFITEILHGCENIAQREFGITVTVTYENDLQRNIWTQEELQNNIHVSVLMEGTNQDLKEQEEKIRKLIDSYFGVTMDVVFRQEAR